MQVIIYSGQSLLNIALQECGAFEAALSLSRRNDIAMTDDLPAGRTVEVLPEDVASRRVVERLSALGVKPATALSAQDIEILNEQNTDQPNENGG